MTRARVLRTERITPRVIRLILGGVDLVAFQDARHTDQYVKLLFAPSGVDYAGLPDLPAIRRELPREDWPRLRTYTVRTCDHEVGELGIDVVHHGDHGLTGPWVASLRPGDPVLFTGPGGGYAPSPDADWHLLVGDESALPAIAVSVSRLPANAVARVFIEVAGPEEEQELAATSNTEITWLHRGRRPVGEALVRAVRALEFPPGQVHAFVHGEAGFVRDLRKLLRVERRVPLERLSISGYWRCGTDDEGWRSMKADWNREVEAKEKALST